MMFMNESTENLLDILENELTEVIELENPLAVEVEVEAVPQNPPIPAKRQQPESSQSFPVPAARSKLSSLDKQEKNNENEIIQLSSLSSSSTSERHQNASQNTIVHSKERRTRSAGNGMLVVQEAEVHESEETKFYVSKRGKWAEEDEKISDEEKKVSVANEESEAQVLSPKAKKNQQQPQLEIIKEKEVKSPSKDLATSNSTNSTRTSFESSGETSLSSSSEESLKPLRKQKKKRDKKKSKKKASSEDQATSVDNSADDNPKSDYEHSIGIFIHSTGALKYSVNLRGLKVKLSLYNEDSGKQIGEVKWSKHGSFNDDFHNLVCTWNEMLLIDEGFKRLQEIHNNVIVFFEISNTDSVIVFWAFLKLISPNHANIDDKFQLQLFQYQKMNRKVFISKLRKLRYPTEENIFEQWRLVDRKKFKSILVVTVKVLNKMPENAPTVADLNPQAASIDSINRKWQKLPGQACKIPNKLFTKISFREKGSMNVRFSHDGNLIAFTEVTKDGSILHVQKFPELQEIFTMLEHSDLIHDIDWLRQKPNSLDSPQFMLTASSDFTANVWRFEASSYTYHILPHPSFVYASKFLQTETAGHIQVVTAGRDCLIRIWQSRKKLEGFELVQELKHPNTTKTSYITAIVTRNSDTFYTSSSNGDVIEWTLQTNKNYHMNRQFKLDEIKGMIITCLEIHPRGNKIFLRVQDFGSCSDMNGTIFVLGVPTGLITQKHHQPSVHNESQGKLRVTTCGTHLFASNGSLVRFYSLQNGSLTSSTRNFLKIRIPSDEKISSIDYHPRDFFLACSLYGRNGGIVICSFEADPEERDLFEKLKVESQRDLHRTESTKFSGTHFSDIIRKLDEVFLAPADSELSKHQEMISRHDENTINDSKRSRTYTVSQGPATYTIQKSQNNTYEVQRKDESEEDDTTITESFN